MPGPSDVLSRRLAWPGAMLIGLVLATAWLPSALAQNATPAADGASPVAMASPAARTADCAMPLGLAPGSACLVVIHAAAGTPAIDVLVDGKTAIQGLAFGQASPYIGVPAGQRQIEVTAAGDAAGTALLYLPLPLEAGMAYEVAVVGKADALTAAILSDNLDPLMEDRARIRILQTIPDAPPADVAVAGGETIFPDVEYGSATGYAEVPAGRTPVDLEVRVAGGAIAFPIPRATLEPGMVYTFYAIGQITDPASLRVLPVLAPASGSVGAGTPAPTLSAIPLTAGTPAAATPAA
jgi:hypothetical protein